LRRDLEANNRTSNINVYPTEHQATALLPNSATLGSGTIDLPKLENAVAIMTCSNITREPADDWIGSGIAETVTADLKNVRGVSVIGRERIFELLKNLGDHPTGEFDETFAIDMGRRLGAAWMINGGYQ